MESSTYEASELELEKPATPYARRIGGAKVESGVDVSVRVVGHRWCRVETVTEVQVVVDGMIYCAAKRDEFEHLKTYVGQVLRVTADELAWLRGLIDTVGGAA